MTTSDYLLPDGTVPVLLSAGTAALVGEEAAALLRYATDHPEVTPQAVAAMLFRTRTARPHRALAMVADRGGLLDACQAIIDARDHPAVARTSTPGTGRRVGYVFPGQGGQWPGMGRIYYDSVPAYRAEADRCTQAFAALGADSAGSPLDYLLDDQLRTDDSAADVQPALFTQMAGLAAMWRSFGVAPKATVGHSQGEVAAAYVAGAITLTDAVRLVAIRARTVDRFAAGDYAMAVVAAGRDGCEDILARCSGWAELSVVNSASMTGVAGDRKTVQSIVDTLTEQGTFARVIRVRYPAHTSWINRLGESVRADVQRHLQNPAFLETETTCLGGTLGGPITAGMPAEEYWFWNLRNTVRFDKAVATASALGVDAFVELSAHPTLQLAIEENLTAAADQTAGRHPMVVGTGDRTATDLTAFTRNLALLAVNDLNYPWDCLQVAADCPPVLPLADFPNSCMGEVSLWLPYGAPAGAGKPAQQAVADGASAQLLTEQWVRLSQRSLAPPRTIGIVDWHSGCSELAGALCDAAAAAGAEARVIDPQHPGATGDLDTWMILVPRSPRLDDGAAAAAVATFFGERTWWPGVTGTAGDCWLVTVGGEVVIADDPPPDPVHAAAAAGFRCIGAEHPGVAFCHLDLPAGWSPTESAAPIISALHTEQEPELALRNGCLYAKRIVAADTASAAADVPPPEHVLIVGGTGNLGLEFCEHFARRGARRITLVSRSGETGAAADRLRRIRSATSTQIVAAVCDVADQVAVSRLAEQHGDPPADLIIHAALAYSYAELGDVTVRAAEHMLRAKVIGIWRIMNAFPRAGNCRVVLCSSAAATIGGRGQVVYAAANRMLDAMAQRLRAEGVDCVSVQWGQWTVHFNLDDAGWAKLAATGLLSMRPADAIAVGMSSFDANVVVAAFDLARARPVLAAYGYGPLLAELRAPDVTIPAVPVGTAPDLAQRLMGLLADAVGADGADGIAADIPLVAIGLDSLQALEFRRRVKTEFGRDLDVSDLLGGASITDVLARLGG